MHKIIIVRSIHTRTHIIMGVSCGRSHSVLKIFSLLLLSISNRYCSKFVWIYGDSVPRAVHTMNATETNILLCVKIALVAGSAFSSKATDGMCECARLCVCVCARKSERQKKKEKRKYLIGLRGFGRPNHIIFQLKCNWLSGKRQKSSNNNGRQKKSKEKERCECC